MKGRYTLLCSVLMALTLHSGPSSAEPAAAVIDSIDWERATIVINDVAYGLAPNLSIRDADGKALSRSALRKGIRVSATPEREPGKRRFLITEIEISR